MSKLVKRSLAVGSVVAAGAVAIGRTAAPRAALDRAIGQTSRRLRDLAGRLEGVRYRIAGRTPDPNVDDRTLADRVRSTLGPIEKRLDTPRVHVSVEDHIVSLHGEVPSDLAAESIEHAVHEISGVHGVESYLHAGLSRGSTRPSTGQLLTAAQPSRALEQMLAAAVGAGTEAAHASGAVRAVLSQFCERIPADEREQLLCHLPDDLRELATPPRRVGERSPRPRTVVELAAGIAADDEIAPERAREITRALVTCLRGLVPEEVADVAAVLPPELARLWTESVAIGLGAPS